MDLERINIALRPRPDWEAADLGLRLTQRHADLAFPMWFAASAPYALLIGGVCIALGNAALAIFFFWWIKPLFERVLLHLYGRLIFDDRPNREELLRALWRQPFTAGWLRALTYRRFEFARSFHLPVWQLEQLRGEARRRRAGVLQAGGSGAAVLLSAASLALVVLFYATVTLLILSLLVRNVIVVDPFSFGSFVGEMLDRFDNAGIGWDVAGFAIYWLCEGIVAPFYVGAGFCLYLNRRTHLEAWDVEMQFRRSARRRGLATAAAVLIVALAAGFLPPGPAPALAQDDAARSAREAVGERIDDIIASDDFGHWETRTRWVPKNRPEEETREVEIDDKPGVLAWLERLLGSLSELLLWTLAAAGVWLLIRHRDRWLKYLTGAGALTGKRVVTAGGLLLEDDALPEDVPGAVRKLWQAGRKTEAASLLYRATLTTLNRRHALRIAPSDTEGDCARRVREVLDRDSAAFFARIARAWQGIAYAHLPPGNDEIDALCEQWSQRLGAAS